MVEQLSLDERETHLTTLRWQSISSLFCKLQNLNDDGFGICAKCGLCGGFLVGVVGLLDLEMVTIKPKLILIE